MAPTGSNPVDHRRRRMAGTHGLRSSGLAALALVGLLASGCSGSEQSPSAGTSTPAAGSASIAPGTSEPGETTAGTTAGSSASGQSLDALITAAQAEGSVTAYMAVSDDVLKSLTDDFQQRYGITVNAQKLVGNTQIERYQTEKQAGQSNVDVLQNSDYPFFEATAASGELVDLSTLPNAATWPEKFWAGGSTQIVNYSISQYTIVWNTDLLGDQRIESWDDLLTVPADIPIALVDPTQSDQYITRYGRLIEELGQPYFDQLVARANFQFTSTAPGVQSLAAGEYGVLVMATWDPVTALKAQGAPIDGWSPADYVGGSERMAGVLAAAPHPNAAKLWVNYLMSPDAQTIINGTYNTISPLPNIPGAQVAPADLWVTDYSYIEKYRSDVLGAFSSKFGG